MLLSLQHENIISVKDMVVGRDHEQVIHCKCSTTETSGYVLSYAPQVYMVMEYMEHDIKMLMDTRMTSPFTQSEVRSV